MTKSLIQDNYADTDSAIAFIKNDDCMDKDTAKDYCFTSQGLLNISECNFVNNSATEDKVGLIYVAHSSLKMTVLLSTFTDNFIENNPE